MKITSNINNFNAYKFLNNKPQDNVKTTSNHSTQPSVPFAYRDYNVSFGARLHRTPEDFYAQSFNINNMPDTVKKFLYEDFDEHHHMPPAQLQRNAFKYLKIADNVTDVKDMYPDEPLFAKLRPFSETKANRGTLFLLRWDAASSKTPIFNDKSEKDLTVYLLKKVYLDGKTLKEINQDFEKDSTPAIRKELGVTDGKYFTYSDLGSLGVRYPNMAYYQSFLATREDKEYIPVKRGEAVETTEQSDKTQPRVMSEETKSKLSDAKKRWWASLSQEEREAQLQRMLEGKELSNSVYAKYQGPIMTIAAAKIGFSNRLISIIEEKLTDTEFNEENDTFIQKQREIMLEFWNKDSYFKRNYSNALKSVIQDFENAYENANQERLEDLLNQALIIKKSVMNKAQERRQAKVVKVEPKPQETPVKTQNPKIYTPVQPVKKEPVFDIESPKDVNKRFREEEASSMLICTDAFKDEMIKFLLNTVPFKDKQLFVALNMEKADEYLGITAEGNDELSLLISEKIQKYNDMFNKTHPLIANTNDFVLCQHLYEMTGDPTVFRFERGDFNEYIENNGLYTRFLSRKPLYNKDMKRLAISVPTKELDDFFINHFVPYVQNLQNETYTLNTEFFNDDNFTTYVQGSLFFLNNDGSFRKQAYDFFKNYNANIKYLKSHPQNGKDYKVIMQNMILEYAEFLVKIQND